MNLRLLAAWISGLALLGTGAAMLRAQPPQAPRQAQARSERDKLRAEVIRLRTEVEALRFDYELARDNFLEELKMGRGLKMAGAMFGLAGAMQSAVNQAEDKPPGEAPPKETEQDRKKAAGAAKAVADQQEKKQAAQETAMIAEAKKELASKFALLTAKRLDLEDAERNYREFPR